MGIKNQCRNGIGRKRTILVDTLGLPLAIKVTPANVSDNEAGIKALEELKGNVTRLQKITADNGYKLTFTEHVKDNFGWEVEIAQKPESTDLFLKKIGGRLKGVLVG
jgi:putative transposase